LKIKSAHATAGENMGQRREVENKRGSNPDQGTASSKHKHNHHR
jgi:hypothetical protein